jgi:hypothetical protein
MHPCTEREHQRQKPSQPRTCRDAKCTHELR